MLDSLLLVLLIQSGKEFKMTLTHAVCAECKKEFDYELKPGFPRKYCPECSAIKKAEFEKNPNVIKPVPNNVGQVYHSDNTPRGIVQEARHDIIISRTEKPHSYEFGKAGNRFKVYYSDVKDLQAHIKELSEAGLYCEFEVEKIN